MSRCAQTHTLSLSLHLLVKGGPKSHMLARDTYVRTHTHLHTYTQTHTPAHTQHPHHDNTQTCTPTQMHTAHRYFLVCLCVYAAMWKNTGRCRHNSSDWE